MLGITSMEISYAVKKFLVYFLPFVMYSALYLSYITFAVAVPSIPFTFDYCLLYDFVKLFYDFVKLFIAKALSETVPSPKDDSFYTYSHNVVYYEASSMCTLVIQ